jgi:hypothetical protein
MTRYRIDLSVFISDFSLIYVIDIVFVHRIYKYVWFFMLRDYMNLEFYIKVTSPP